MLHKGVLIMAGVKLNFDKKKISIDYEKIGNSPGTLYLSDLKILDSLYQKLLLSSGYTKIKFNVLKLNGYIIK